MGGGPRAVIGCGGVVVVGGVVIVDGVVVVGAGVVVGGVVVGGVVVGGNDGLDLVECLRSETQKGSGWLVWSGVWVVRGKG